MKILVTGGAGFIGSHVARALIADGHGVVVLDNLSTGHRCSVPDEARLVVGDIRCIDDCLDAADGCDAVVHCAAMISVPQSVRDPELCRDVNVSGTRNVLFAAAAADVKRFVLLSSSSVYESSDEAVSEDAMLDPRSPYAESKLTAEVLTLDTGRTLVPEAVVLRLFNVYGPGQSVEGGYAAVVARFANDLKDENRPTVHGTGLQSRDFVHVDDVVQAVKIALTHKNAVGRILNVGGGRSVTVLELLEEMCLIVGARCNPDFEPRRAGDVENSLACLDEIRSLGYEPRIELRKGLADLLSR